MGEIIEGTEGDDDLQGTSQDDQISGLGGNDRLTGLRGADYLDGGPGTDTAVYIGDFGVMVSLEEGVEGAGGQAEGDILVNIESIEGTQGDDIFIGNDDPNLLIGNNGNDILSGHGGNDQLIGGEGNEILDGGQGADILDGGEGIDKIVYSGQVGVLVSLLNSDDNAFGEAQGDVIIDVENVDGTPANDIIIGNEETNVIHGKEGDDVLRGSSGDDILYGDEGDDTIYGGPGTDILIGGYGGDIIDGGPGLDRVVYTERASVLVDLSNNSRNAGGEAWGDILINIENIDGGKGNDILYGNSDFNELRGMEGDDTLDGGGGNDVLAGGEGTDTFVVTKYSDGDEEMIITITDFNPKTERIMLQNFSRQLSYENDIVPHLETAGDDNVVLKVDNIVITFVGPILVGDFSRGTFFGHEDSNSASTLFSNNFYIYTYQLSIYLFIYL